MDNELLERSLQISDEIGLDISIVERIGVIDGSSNLLYLIRFNGKPAVLKIFRDDGNTKIAREKSLSEILSKIGIKTPHLYYDSVGDISFIVEEYLDGNCPTDKKSLILRSADCANLHVRTIGQIYGRLESYTDDERMVIMREMLKTLHLTNIPRRLISLIESQVFLVENFPFCCTFYDFVPSNSKTKSSDSSLYYFDFERARVTIPFFDPACLVLYRKEDIETICGSYHKTISYSVGPYGQLSYTDVKRYTMGAAVEKCIEILSFFQGDNHIDQSVREDVVEKYRTNLLFLLDRIDKDANYNVKVDRKNE